MTGRMIFIVCLSILLSSTLNLAHSEGMDLDVCVDATVVSKYIWRGFDVLDANPAFQPSIDLSFGDTGLGFNIWGSMALDDRSNLDDYDEVDFGLSFERDLTDYFSFSVGSVLYWYPNLDEDDTTYEVFFGGTLTQILFNPALTLYYDLDLGDDLYAELSGSHDIPAGDYELSTSLTIGYNNGQYEVDRGFSDMRLSASMDFPVWKLTITPGLNYTFILEDTVNEDNGEFSVSLGVCVEF